MLAFTGPSLADDNKILRLATTTSTNNSGLLGILSTRFIKDTGYQLDIHVVGTGTALRLGRTGKVDVLMVHAPESEQKFIQEGHGINRLPVMHNDFVIVGPAKDPAGLNGIQDVKAAFKILADSDSTFISRSDDSGNHKKEKAIWSTINIDPYGKDWYLETGTSMGNSLKQASELQAYILTDRGTWLANKSQLNLVIQVEGDPLLHNPYSVININPERHPDINIIAAKKFAHWILSAEVQQLISDYRIDGEPLFIPDAPR